MLEARSLGVDYERFARLASQANVAFGAYARHFGGKPRLSRDVALLGELIRDLEAWGVPGIRSDKSPRGVRERHGAG